MLSYDTCHVGYDSTQYRVRLTCVTIETMKHMEPGLLQVFRLYVGTWLAVMLLALCGALSDNKEAVNFLLMVIASTLLMGYLAWPLLRRKLGRYFLPIALFGATASPILIEAFSVFVRMLEGTRGNAAWPDPGLTTLWLFVPMIFVSVQYGFRWTTIYIVGATLAELSLYLALAILRGPALGIMIEQGLFRLIIFIPFAYLVSKLMNGQREERRALALSNARLAHYATTLEQLAVSRERNRMARELHDTLAHTLSAVAVQLEAVDVLWDTDPIKARETLTLSKDLTRNGLTEARRALKALRASPLEDLGLILAVRHLAQMNAERAGLQLSMQTAETLGELHPTIQQTIYRIAEEAMNNVVRHANASALGVMLGYDGGQLKLLVMDNGEGFDLSKATQNGHYGLVGMQERAALCGGQLNVQSQPGQGTRVEFSVEMMKTA
ncbi:MAG: sensor histidine kinase [Anaerolineae bacterium]|nr:sensor histidine kinase [Anaerolineae bacterium]